MIKAITGTFFEFDHHNRFEGKYYNDAMYAFSENQWREKVRETAQIGMDTLVLMATCMYDECYYDGGIFPYAKQLKCKKCLEVLLDEADKTNQNVFLSAGFYNDWLQPKFNTTDPDIIKRSLDAMNFITEKFGHHKCICGWYMPDEWQIEEHFDEKFIKYINTISAEARKLNKNNKTLIAPYGTHLAKADDKYIKQLESMDLDIIAYQDEVGVQKTTPQQEGAYFEALYKAHQKAGRAKIWADMEIFDFEDTVYRSALIPASFDRIKQQMEAISPFVEKIIVYAYQGMMNNPNSQAKCGLETGEKLYSDYVSWLKNNR